MDQPPPSPAQTGASESSAESMIRRAMLYPETYIWYVLLSSLDVMLTWIILHLDGRELNAIADWVIEHFDLAGLVIFKFSLMLFVVVVCEVLGRRNRRAGQTLARWAVALTAFPVVVGLTHLVSAWMEHRLH